MSDAAYCDRKLHANCDCVDGCQHRAAWRYRVGRLAERVWVLTSWRWTLRWFPIARRTR